MKNVSNEFRQTMAKRTDFYMKANVEFVDGTEKELSRSDFYLSGNSYTDAAGSSSFPLGVALEKQIEISIVNDKDQFSTYDFYGAKFTVYCCLDLDNGTTEKILLGTFTVTEPETYGSVIVVNAVDDMYKGDTDYSTNLSFPMTLQQAMLDSCSTCGVMLFTTTFTNDDYVISAAPEGITHRALWGLCAMLAGGNARMDEYNRLRIVSYDFSLFDKGVFNGGVFDGDQPYSSGDSADGGSFNPWSVSDVVNGGTFTEMKGYHVFWKAKNLTVATDDVVVTGVQTTVDNETYLFGETGYILSVTNQLIEGDPQDAVNRIGALIVGVRFRPFQMDHTAYPLAEVGDLCFVLDRKQNVYQSIVTDVNFTFYGFTTLQCQADSPIRNSSKYNSQVTQAIVRSRLNTEKQITEYDKEVQLMTSLMSNSMGMYETKELTESGGVIVYQHNKPTLEESDIIWRKSEQGFQVSTDGGDTWNAGMTADGRVVVNVLSVIGIQADWLRVTDLYAIGATIGGWKISASAIYKDVTASDGSIYRVYFQPPLLSNPEKTWILSCQKSTNGGKSFTGTFILYSDGSAKFGNTTISAGGEIISSFSNGTAVSITSDGLKVKNGNEVNVDMRGSGLRSIFRLIDWEKANGYEGYTGDIYITLQGGTPARLSVYKGLITALYK